MKEVKLTPDLFKGLSLDNDFNYGIFQNREENKKFLKGLSGEVHMKAEGLLKFEYCILQERSKNGIVKEYIEDELKHLESEKNEAMKEREKYQNLLALER